MLAEVRLWDKVVGAVSLAEGATVADFEFDPRFVGQGLQVAPLTMPLSSRAHRFPALRRESFHGLPGLLADSLPDRFGNALIDAWLAGQGRTPESFSVVERLCYVGSRGMGALEFQPALGPQPTAAARLQVAGLVELAAAALGRRGELEAAFSEADGGDAFRQILQVGTSAGGARPKALIAWNPKTSEVRAGDLDAPEGFEHWLLKLDGVAGELDAGGLEELPGGSLGYGAVEYAYHLMAKDAGLTMAECRLLEEGGRRHFMTRRFDRLPSGEKLHMQSLGGIAHFDFHAAGAHAYEQALLVIRRLGLGMDAVEEQYRRMVFNILARNQDDHVKNIAFLMDALGNWSLAPAFDVTYAWQPAGRWTALHQMTLNGKRDAFAADDFLRCARDAAIARARALAICREVAQAVARWGQYAEQAGVGSARRDRIASALRTTLFDE